MTTPPLHDEIAALSFLLGTWSGTGRGEYPTIDAFEFEETVTFSHAGKPYLTYSQQTRHPANGRALHQEVGYVRLGHLGSVELVVAHPTGLVEVHEGELDGTSLHLRSRLVAGTGSAKEVTAVERRLAVQGDVLRYTLAMAAVGQPLGRHLVGELRRAEG